jgi:hypothetical protein
VVWTIDDQNGSGHGGKSGTAVQSTQSCYFISSETRHYEGGVGAGPSIAVR